ncbi:hypothetical protein Tco_0739145 [Tanacetum coccineum]
MTGGHYENTRRQFSSNEDFTKKISHSVFVTNFPDYVNSRDLWNKCSVYGTIGGEFMHDTDWALSSVPALVLDEECVVERDFSNCDMGRVDEGCRTIGMALRGFIR